MPVIGEEAQEAEGVGRGRAIGVLDGLALGLAAATVVAALGIRARSNALLTYWAQERTESTRLATVLVGEVGVVVVLLVLVVWLLDEGGARKRRWPIAAGVGVALLVTAWLIALTDFYVWPPAVAGGLLGLVVLGLATASGRRRSRAVVGLTAAVVAVVVGFASIAIPSVRHRVPPRELIDWWAAHDNPPISFGPSLSMLRAALDQEDRDVRAVEAACREMRNAFTSLAGEPLAPSKLQGDIVMISHDLVSVADRCESEASFITQDGIVVLLNAATSSPASQRFNAALNP